jgi:hypothetical protein
VVREIWFINLRKEQFIRVYLHFSLPEWAIREWGFLNANYFITKRYIANPRGRFLENFIFDRNELKYVKKIRKLSPSKALFTTVTFALKYTCLNRKYSKSSAFWLA